MSEDDWLNSDRRAQQVEAMRTESVQLLIGDGDKFSGRLGAMAHHNMLVEYFKEEEPFTANVIRKGPPSVEQLAVIIRKVDGNHDKGAGELAELILKELGA